MKNFCVIGYPIGHSKSPLLHEAGFCELGIEAEFRAVEVKPEDLENWIKYEFPNFLGAAVTIPHKENIRKFIDEEMPAAKAIGAVNTLFWKNGKIGGTNTDCFGALKALQTEIPNLAGKRVLVLGAGGAARAVIFALKTAGTKIWIWNRTIEKSENLAREFEIPFVQDLKALDPQNFDIIINTTAVGLKKWESILPEDFWQPHHTAFDIVYDPLETKFLSDAESAGACAITGDKMLVFQALEQFRIWNGVALEPEIMERAFFAA